MPGMTVVSLENYSSVDPSHLKMSQGDVIEVTGSTDTGLLEGTLRGQTGYFPREAVQEVEFLLDPGVPGVRSIGPVVTM